MVGEIGWETEIIPEIMRLYLSTKRSGKFGAEKNKRFQQSFDLQAGLEGSNKWRQTMCENSECKLLKWGSSFLRAKSLKQSAWLWKAILLGLDFLHKALVSGWIGVIVVMFWRTRRSPPSQTSYKPLPKILSTNCWDRAKVADTSVEILQPNYWRSIYLLSQNRRNSSGHGTPMGNT